MIRLHCIAVCAVGLSIGLVPPAFAAKEKKIVDVRAILQQAQAGDAKAEVKLGNMYESGKGVARDYLQAIQWYQKAVDQGDLAAMCDLAMVYINGHGVAKDYQKAGQLLEPAANAGLPQAQYQLGALYEKGEGVRFQDFRQAADWLTRAANQNNKEAQFDLGDLYFNGQGVAQSYEDAYFWYLLAGNHKLGKSQQKADQLKLTRIRDALSPQQLDAVQQRALQWQPVMEGRDKK